MHSSLSGPTETVCYIERFPLLGEFVKRGPAVFPQYTFSDGESTNEYMYTFDQCCNKPSNFPCSH